MTELTTLLVSSAPLLRAIAKGGDQSGTALAEASGRKRNNIARDLAGLEKAGLITREPGSLIVLTEEATAGLEILDGKGGATVGDGPQIGSVADLPLNLIDNDPELNPREIFNETPLDDLIASVKAKGVLQPILVRPSKTPGRWRVVAGERRWRAANAAGLSIMPALLRDLSDAEALEVATIENIQRENLTPLEEAKAFRAIVDARMAADPELELKDAKAAIAEAVKKSVRFVEYRMELLDLPPMLQIRLNIHEDKDGHLSLREAREELRQMRKAEAAAKARILKPAELLICAEVADACAKHPVPPEGWHYPDSPPAECSYLAAGPDLERLIKAEKIDFSRNWHGKEDRCLIRLGWKFPKKDLVEQLPGFATPKRAAALHELRVAVLGQEAADAIKAAKIYACEWLNGPFELDPALVAQHAESAAREIEREAAKSDEDKAKAAAAETHKAEVARDMGETGKAFLAAVRGFEVIAPTLSDVEFKAAFAEILGGHNLPAPWSIRWDEKDRTASMYDANGAENRAAGPALEARRRLLVIAINHAAGFPIESGPDLPAPWVIESRGVPPEAEDQPEDEPEQVDLEDLLEEAETEDAEIPAALRNLAGPGAQAITLQ